MQTLIDRFKATERSELHKVNPVRMAAEKFSTNFVVLIGATLSTPLIIRAAQSCAEWGKASRNAAVDRT